MGNRSFKIGLLAKGALVLAFGLCLAASANAATLRRAASTGSNGSAAGGGPTGNYLFTYYDIGNAVGKNPHTEHEGVYGVPNGDNVLRLIDPNGCGNGGVSNQQCGSETDLCAFIYVFDDDQEMGECCGCRVTPNQLKTLSVRNELVNNWGLTVDDNSTGTIAIVGSAINSPGGVCNPANPACEGGCDPTLGASVTGATNLDGSITHDLVITGSPTVSGLTEIPLFDQGAGETVNNAYLPQECASIIASNSEDAGYCHCFD